MSVFPRTLYLISCDGYRKRCHTVYTRVSHGAPAPVYVTSSEPDESLRSALRSDGWWTGRALYCPDCRERSTRDRSHAILASLQHDALFDLPETAPPPPACRCAHLTPGVRPHPHACGHPSGASWADEWMRTRSGRLRPALTPYDGYALPYDALRGLLGEAYDAGRADGTLAAKGTR